MPLKTNVASREYGEKEEWEIPQDGFLGRNHLIVALELVICASLKTSPILRFPSAPCDTRP
ncbi:hypothetical protein N7447_009320 [Penicillium robsamsonii]|uniref:uncharacterized protein n=1 Tax=Penicillium robsamsonii TaxID=1792511 RepID=UPI0025489D53|nr:uncharacterized protein N7447_009320 [Penicillium robsamsonii]KAJ5817087.1 hypothetical protein N7447_009320 [Penicillium robsamsonii]